MKRLFALWLSLGLIGLLTADSRAVGTGFTFGSSSITAIGILVGDGSGLTNVVHSTDALVLSTGILQNSLNAVILSTQPLIRYANWDSAYSWGAPYITSTATIVSDLNAVILSTQPLIRYANWDSAYSWGAPYITSTGTIVNSLNAVILSTGNLVPYTGSDRSTNLGNFAIISSSNVVAKAYQINTGVVGGAGTVLALSMPGNDSVTAGGLGNWAVGKSALLGTVSGSFNTGIGQNACGSVVVSSNSTCVGYGAGTYGTSYSNTYVGTSAGLNTNHSTAVGGWQNTAVGHSALERNRSGTANTALGYWAALGGGATANISSNTTIGYAAGGSLQTGAYNNTCLGINSCVGLATGTGNLLIGSVDTPTNATNNYLNVGGLIVGDMSTSSVTIKTSLFASSITVSGTITSSTHTIQNADLVFSTTTGSQGITFQDGTRQTSAISVAVAVTTTSESLNLPIPNGLTNYSVAVATVVAPLLGGRPVLYLWVVTITNSGANGISSCQMSQNGTPLTVSRRLTGVPASTDYATLSGHTLIPTASAGSMTLTLRCNGDNASFTASTPHLSIMEF